MSYTSTEVKRRWNEKNYDRLTVLVPKDKEIIIKKYVQEHGTSVNGLINALMQKATGITESEWKKDLFSVHDITPKAVENKTKAKWINPEKTKTGKDFKSMTQKILKNAKESNDNKLQNEADSHPKTPPTPGERIKEIRKENGLTQTEFAKEISVSTTTVCQLEKEKYNISRTTEHILCQRFNINPEWIQTGAEPKYAVSDSILDTSQKLTGILSKTPALLNLTKTALWKFSPEDWEKLNDLAEKISSNS